MKDGGVIGCREVTHAKKLEMMNQACNRYGDNGFQAKQLVFPDEHGKLPWQPEFNTNWGQQPIFYELDENGK
jgi:lysyl-tRNA synthetase class I